jgi:hypothetical protein
VQSQGQLPGVEQNAAGITPTGLLLGRAPGIEGGKAVYTAFPLEPRKS